MKTFKKILFPVDLSPSSEKIVPFVQTMATQFGAAVHLLFAARVFEYFQSIYVPHPSINLFEEEIVKGATRRIDEFKSEHFSAYPDTKAVVILGEAAEVIRAYIAENAIDLLIMGTHGRKGLDKVIFGSVAERVIKACPVPMFIINPNTIA
ncbi:MAG: universal stress protein [Pseudomonadota bacterium]